MCVLAAVWLTGCGSSAVFRSGAITVVPSERLELDESLLHIPADSVVELYRLYDHDHFYRRYSGEVQRTAELIDSLNGDLPFDRRIDTLSIEFALEQFGTAARRERILYMSSAFFFVYNDPSVIRSVVTHEFGHIRYELLSPERKVVVESIWHSLRRAALLYLFVDGEYSGNARFGGHPEDSPEELLASAFNLFCNKPDELRAHLRYVPEEYYPLLDTLKSEVGVTSLVLFE